MLHADARINFPAEGRPAPNRGQRMLRAVLVASAAMVFAAAIPVSAAQQSQDQQNPTLGDIARKARVDKQQAQPAPKKVWTNDNIPTNSGAISIVGTPPPPPAESAETQEKAPVDLSKPGAMEVKDMTAAQIVAAYRAAKPQLELMEKQLDLAKRDYKLQQDAFYADNAMASQDVAGQAKLADVQKGIDALQAAVDKEQEYVTQLEARAAELNIDLASATAAAPAGEGGQPATPPSGSSTGTSSGSGSVSGQGSGSGSISDSGSNPGSRE
jgi:hypothetical protein